MTTEVFLDDAFGRLPKVDIPTRKDRCSVNTGDSVLVAILPGKSMKDLPVAHEWVTVKLARGQGTEHATYVATVAGKALTRIRPWHIFGIRRREQ